MTWRADITYRAHLYYGRYDAKTGRCWIDVWVVRTITDRDGKPRRYTAICKLPGVTWLRNPIDPAAGRVWAKEIAKEHRRSWNDGTSSGLFVSQEEAVDDLMTRAKRFEKHSPVLPTILQTIAGFKRILREIQNCGMVEDSGNLEEKDELQA